MPGHPFFDDYLYCTLPPGWRDFAFHNPNFAFVARAGSRLLEAVTESEMNDYVYGGELDEVQGEDEGDYFI